MIGIGQTKLDQTTYRRQLIKLSESTRVSTRYFKRALCRCFVTQTGFFISKLDVGDQANTGSAAEVIEDYFK